MSIIMLTILVAPAPSIFPFCYNIVKHIFDERTKKKVVILGINCKWYLNLLMVTTCGP